MGLYFRLAFLSLCKNIHAQLILKDNFNRPQRAFWVVGRNYERGGKAFWGGRLKRDGGMGMNTFAALPF